MKIQQLRLINVKSYQDETLDFGPGINFISGINGAGKSTIIESLGYALFNYNPYVLKQFLREGASQGEIQVLIEAVDERLYRVIRKFTANASTKWEVWDEETASVLQELHGSEDVQRWLKEMFGVASSDDLADLFRQVIAVQQGQFTAPFLEPPSSRTQTFDAILKVEDYRIAFGQTAFLEKAFLAEATSLQAQREIVASTFEERLPQLVLEQKQMLKAEQAKQSQLEQLTEDLQANQGLLAQAEHKQKQVEDLNKSLDLLQVKLDHLQGQLQITTEDLEGAKEAKELVQLHELGFNHYEQAQRSLVQVEKKLAEKQSLVSKIGNLQLELTAVKAKYEGDFKRYNQDLSSIAEEQQAAKQKLDMVLDQVKHLQTVEEELLAWFPFAVKWQEPFRTFESWLKLGRPSFDQARFVRQNLAELAKSSAELSANVANLPKLLAELANLGPADALELVQDQITDKQRELAGLMRNEEHLTQGLCPIILEACPSERVTGGLDQFFKAQKASLEAKIEQLRKAEAEAKKIQDQRVVLEEQVQLGHQQANLLQKQTERYTELLKLCFENLASLAWPELTEIEHTLALLKLEYEDQASNLLGKIQEWQVPVSLNLPDPPELIARAPSLPEKGDLAELGSWLVQLASWESECISLEAKWRNYGQTWSEQMHQIQNQVATKQALAKEEGNRLAKLQQSTLERETVLSQEKTRLGEVEQALAEKSRIFADLEHQVAACGKPEVEQSKLKAELEQTKSSYQLYQANILGAAKVDSLQARLVSVNSELAELSLQLQAKQGSLAEVSTVYFPKEHQALQVKVEEQKKAHYELSRDIQELARQQEDFGCQIQELQARQRHWLKLGQELAETQKAHEFTKLFRQVLKEAADPIAQQYRDLLAILATQIYQQVSPEQVRLEWGSQYELQLLDYDQGQERTRVFRQLSGGEQMTAALAIRLALMQLLSPLRLGFFDEPTTNLDQKRRTSLALAIQLATRDFEQLFLISHDDSFDSVTDQIISVQKASGQGSKVIN